MCLTLSLYRVQVLNPSALTFVCVCKTHALEFPLPAETAEYFTGAPCPLMPALILHGALQEEFSGDARACVCVRVCVCVCVRCVLMSLFFVKTTVESCLMLLFLSLLLKTHNRYFQSQKCRCVFLFSSCVVHLFTFLPPITVFVPFIHDVSEMLRHAVDKIRWIWRSSYKDCDCTWY